MPIKSEGETGRKGTQEIRDRKARRQGGWPILMPNSTRTQQQAHVETDSTGEFVRKQTTIHSSKIQTKADVDLQALERLRAASAPLPPPSDPGLLLPVRAS